MIGAVPLARRNLTRQRLRFALSAAGVGLALLLVSPDRLRWAALIGGAAIATGEIAKKAALTDLIGKLKQSGGTCHLIGLVSPGGVHSHQDHAVALAKILTDAGVATVLHALTDGRDTPPQAAAALHRQTKAD